MIKGKLISAAIGCFVILFNLLGCRSSTDTVNSAGTTQSKTVSDVAENSQITKQPDISIAPNIAGAVQKTFTRTELAKYNGKNGMAAYVAVDGNVYNLSRVFKSGFHYSHAAGRELTSAFYSYHIRESMAKYPVIGKLQ
jgi:predicted heme/steroid binding protein